MTQIFSNQTIYLPEHLIKKDEYEKISKFIRINGGILASEPDVHQINVLPIFEGSDFENYKNSNYPIFSLNLLKEHIQEKQPLPPLKSGDIIFSTLMRNIVITTTQLPKQTKEIICNYASYMGAKVNQEYTNFVTHLVAVNMDTNKCKVAKERKSTIVIPDWICKCWENGVLLDTKPFFPSDNVEQNLQMGDKHVKSQGIFKGCKIAISGFKREQKQQAIKWIIENQGQYCKNVDEFVTHFISATGRLGGKYGIALKYKIQNLVNYEWLEASVQANQRMSEAQYPIKSQVKLEDKTNELLASTKQLINSGTKIKVEEPVLIFKDISFLGRGMENEIFEDLTRIIMEFGGMVFREVSHSQPLPFVQYILVPHGWQDQNQSTESSIPIVSPSWLELCVLERRIVSPNAHITCKPLPKEIPYENTKGKKICTTGFTGFDGKSLKILIIILGFKFVTTLEASCTALISVTHSITPKCIYASDWKVPVVKVDWLLDSAKIGKILPHSDYLIPLEHLQIVKKLKSDPANSQQSSFTPSIPSSYRSYTENLKPNISRSSSNLRNSTSSANKKDAPLSKSSSSSKKGNRDESYFFNNGCRRQLEFETRPTPAKINEPAAPILIGVTIFISRRLDEMRNKLLKVANSVGAGVSSKLTESVTHILHHGHNAKDFEHNFNPTMKVVSPVWLEECKNHGKWLNENDFPCSLHPKLNLGNGKKSSPITVNYSTSTSTSAIRNANSKRKYSTEDIRAAQSRKKQKTISIFEKLEHLNDVEILDNPNQAAQPRTHKDYQPKVEIVGNQVIYATSAQQVNAQVYETSGYDNNYYTYNPNVASYANYTHVETVNNLHTVQNYSHVPQGQYNQLIYLDSQEPNYPMEIENTEMNMSEHSHQEGQDKSETTENQISNKEDVVDMGNEKDSDRDEMELSESKLSEKEDLTVEEENNVEEIEVQISATQQVRLEEIEKKKQEDLEEERKAKNIILELEQLLSTTTAKPNYNHTYIETIENPPNKIFPDDVERVSDEFEGSPGEDADNSHENIFIRCSQSSDDDDFEDLDERIEYSQQVVYQNDSWNTIPANQSKFSFNLNANNKPPPKSKTTVSNSNDVSNICKALNNTSSTTSRNSGYNVVPDTKKISTSESPTYNKCTQEKKVFAFSMMPPDEKKQFEAIVEHLGGIVVETESDFKEITHVIAGNLSKSSKLLAAVAGGKWVVKSTYLEDCSKNGCWVDEHPHEWNEDNCPGDENALIPVPRRWRRIISNTKSRPNCVVAFSGMFVALWLKQHFSVFKVVMEIGNAVVLGKNPPYDDNVLTKLTHVVVEEAEVTTENQRWLKILRNNNILLISPKFITDRLTRFPLPSAEEYPFRT